MEGVVTKSTGSWYEITLSDGKNVTARLKGILRLDETDTTNPVAVGDKVMVEKLDQDFVIAQVLPRHNYIVRQSPKHEKARQIIASNISQAILIATVASPRTSTGFIDRFLLTAEAYHIPIVLVFNKCDNLSKKEQTRLTEMDNMYRSIGYSVLHTSVVTKLHIDHFANLLKGKTSLLSGHSGVGKSSLLNCIQPTLHLKTQAVSSFSGKGMHTTTFAEMHFLDIGGSVIDTPGIREFGVSGFKPEEVSHYFIEMLPYLPHCKFHNCLHENEPGCAVKHAVIEGKINQDRFGSYLVLLEEVKQARKHWE
ncbi:MAG: ribosome small subunit-dependent GTPase A [Chitinophagales bacterium]